MSIPSVQQLASLALVSPSQRGMLTQEIKGLDRAINGRSSLPYEGLGAAQNDLEQAGMALYERGERETPDVPVPDINVLRDQLARNKETLQRGTAPEFSPQQKNELWQLAKQLRDTVRHGMPSSEQLERPTQENLDVFMRHQERTIHAQLALRNIIRILDQDDETVVLESLRPVEPSRVNWAEYYGRFDDIYMSTLADLEREITALDEETYTKFLQLRLKGIETPKLLMRTLNLSQGVYEACKLRLERELAALEVEDERPAPVASPTPAAPKSPAKRAHISKQKQAERERRRLAHTAAAEQPQTLEAFAASA